MRALLLIAAAAGLAAAAAAAAPGVGRLLDERAGTGRDAWVLARAAVASRRVLFRVRSDPPGLLVRLDWAVVCAHRPLLRARPPLVGLSPLTVTAETAGPGCRAALTGELFAWTPETIPSGTVRAAIYGD